MATPGIIDPTKAGQYPVILSDALLGKASNETYTGIRYNHRPTLSSDSAPSTARLKRSAKDESYNLGFDDQGDKYQYNGVRTHDDGNYVLIFDPTRKAFVLHRVDSTFHMNITRTPTESNAANLRKQFPHLEITSSIPAKKPRVKATEKANTTNTTNSTNSTPSKAKDGASSKPDKKAVALTLPTLSGTPASSGSPSSQQLEKKSEPPAAQSDQEKKPKRRALSPVESEEEDEDDGDDVLTLEIPQGNPDAFRGSNFSGTMPVSLTRRFSEFARDMERETDEDDDTRMEEELEAGYEEEDEDEGEDEEPPRQPPVQGSHTKTENLVAVEPEVYTFDDGDDDSNADAGGNDALDQDFGDLEAELERELEMVQNEGHESDSSVSEED
ncbi:RNA polymerase II transcription elongation factor-domain-containing protein [Chaetomium strumarium]|uniref:RNA polymerase II transcription elongation factor-domain-containing protein n=1 Tax=Chaetomium strumarium TaxID=1170767 RepID=A0AAJ0H3Y6_9PEZI|nr:RNA polymerase II transcription elongation factor-domain-containing protein [Chaetomium strumarium]